MNEGRMPIDLMKCLLKVNQKLPYIGNLYNTGKMQQFLFYAKFQRKTKSARRLLDLNLYIEKKNPTSFYKPNLSDNWILCYF